ncbi:MAG: hypothetical protein JWR19_1895 [Pedosphaera sp.]|nr:hypothetical protein [Pedosphaera sp.]
MARKLPVQYPGAVYHLLNRGDRCEPIFQADAERALFPDTLAQAGAVAAGEGDDDLANGSRNGWRWAAGAM